MPASRKRKAAPQSDEIIVSQPRKHTKTAHSSAGPVMVSTKSRAIPTVKHTTDMLQSVRTTATQKRKRDVEDETTQPMRKMRNAAPTQSSKTEKVVTPQSRRFRDALPPSPTETPSRKTAKLFDRLDLEQRTSSSHTYDTPPTSPESLQSGFADILPPPVADLVELFAAFVSAINEQTALSRSDFRIEIKELLEVTTKIWKKRATTVDDLRRLLAVLGDKDLDWALEDYGRAGLCLIRSQVTTSISIVDTIKMRNSFKNELQRQWTLWSRTHSDVTEFIEQMPLLDVKKSDAVDRAALLFSRGKERLDSLKKSQAAAQSADVESKKKTDVKPAAVQTRGSNLLDRILAKQAITASMPAGPTKEQLERRSSLQRVEEIVRVLEILASGRTRASFSMQSVVQQLQQSLRSPISRIEAERCLAIIAAEIMPQFVSVVVSGTVEGIVITRAGKLGLADLKQRLADVDV